MYTTESLCVNSIWRIRPISNDYKWYHSLREHKTILGTIEPLFLLHRSRTCGQLLSTSIHINRCLTSHLYSWRFRPIHAIWFRFWHVQKRIFYIEKFTGTPPVNSTGLDFTCISSFSLVSLMQHFRFSLLSTTKLHWKIYMSKKITKNITYISVLFTVWLKCAS